MWCAASLERYREKKATRQCSGTKIRYQIRKTNADNRPRFKVGAPGSSIHLTLCCLTACWLRTKAYGEADRRGGGGPIFY